MCHIFIDDLNNFVFDSIQNKKGTLSLKLNLFSFRTRYKTFILLFSFYTSQINFSHTLSGIWPTYFSFVLNIQIMILLTSKSLQHISLHLFWCIFDFYSYIIYTNTNYLSVTAKSASLTNNRQGNCLKYFKAVGYYECLGDWKNWITSFILI